MQVVQSVKTKFVIPMLVQNTVLLVITDIWICALSLHRVPVSVIMLVICLTSLVAGFYNSNLLRRYMQHAKCVAKLEAGTFKRICKTEDAVYIYTEKETIKLKGFHNVYNKDIKKPVVNFKSMTVLVPLDVNIEVDDMR